MTPGARVAAAIEILDMIHDGQAVEKSLTAWARVAVLQGLRTVRRFAITCLIRFVTGVQMQCVGAVEQGVAA